MNNYTIGNNETTITLPIDALTAQLKMQGLTLLLNHELPAFAAPPPASEGEITDYWRKRCIAAEKVIDSTPYNPFISQKELKLYSAWRKLNSTPVPLATLPTREPEERKFSQSEIEALQSSVYEITGTGEVMGLFNKLLGVSAG